MTATDQESRLARQRWWGLKAPAKRLFSHQPLHAAMVFGSRRFLSQDQVARLPAPASVTAATARMAGVTFEMERPDRCILAKELYWGGGRRPNAVDQTALDIFAALARDAGTVFDIGSYTGIFSLLSAAVSPTARVHAFEVIPEVFLAAWSNVIRNDKVGRIDVHLRAVGASENLCVVRGTGGSALPDFLSTGTAAAEHGVGVPGMHLDELAVLTADGPVLIKIDIEGGEPAAFRSGADFLSEHRPDILCEVLPDTPTDAMATQLRGLGYRFYSVGPGELGADDDLRGLTDRRDWLYTTKTPDELAELVRPVGVRVICREPAG